jgi:hypothetical protein
VTPPTSRRYCRSTHRAGRRSRMRLRGTWSVRRAAAARAALRAPRASIRRAACAQAGGAG